MKLSEHAIKRYQKRIEDVPADEVRKRLMTKELKRMNSAFGGSGLYVTKDCKILTKDHVVVTVYKKSYKSHYSRDK